MMISVPFILFSLVASITPGPTNILVLSHSARYGFWKALPIVLGGCAGAAGIVLVTGVGIGESLTSYPLIQLVMSTAGVLWLSYLAWQIFSSPATPLNDMSESMANDKRVGFGGAAGLQLINPKTWMMAIAVISVFTQAGSDKAAQVVQLTSVFFAISIPCLTAWAVLGASVSRWLDSATRVRYFNRLMGLLLLGSAWLSLL
ncbi:LysE family translocator [Pseudomonas sp.]|uniref:LysE family translocator n=1 Tax=Pseudomonas sp. TaxID=306 RepID=UPI00390C6C43